MSPPLIPNTDFGSVALWTTELAYLSFNQVRDGQTQYLGHHALLTDAELDTGAGSILARVSGILDPFKVTQVGTTGSVITWMSGQFRLPSSSVITIASGQLNLPADSTNYVYINSAGAVVYSTGSTDVLAFAGIPVIRHILAKVVVVSSNIQSITDFRSISIRGATPPANVIRTFGGQSTTDIVVTAGQVLTGTIYCRNFTVPSGISCTVKYYCKVICSGTFVNNGTITGTRYPFGAPPFNTVLLKNGGAIGGLPGIGLGTRGASYDPNIQVSSSGGSLGFAVFPPSEPSISQGYASIGGGGDAGATFIVEAFGLIVQNGTILCDGGNAGVSTTVSDSITAKAIVAGSGGGAGGNISTTSLTGVTYTPTSITSVKGGNGGDGLIVSAGATGYYANGGLGGGGGNISIASPGTIVTTGATINLAGGVAGAMGNYLGAVITVSGASYKVGNAIYGWYGGQGAGFGGNGGQITGMSQDSSYFYFTLSPGSSGQILTSTALPLS